MPNRTAKFAQVLFAGFLAGIPIAITFHGAARATDDCRTAPDDEAPAGRHWYYRIDHASKRQCWYLRAEGEKLSQAAPTSSAPSAKPAGPKAEAPAQHPVEDAHAELPPQTVVEPPSFGGTLTPADAAAGENRWPAVTPEPPAQRSTIGSRWPESPGAPSTLGPPAQLSDRAAGTPPDPAMAQPAAIAAPPAIAPVSPPPAMTGSIPKLLSAVSGALALAGITAGVVLKFAGPRQARLRVRRDAVWDSTDDDRIVLSDDRDEDVLPRRAGFARESAQTGEAYDRIAEFCAQLSRRTPT